MNLLRSGFVACALLTLVLSAFISGCSTERAEVVPAPNIPAGSQPYDIFLAKSNGSQKKIGQVAVDKEYRLQIISVIPSQKNFLTDTVEAMNNKATLHAEAAPPQGAPQFSDFSRVVDRNSPAFFTQLQVHLKQYYDLVLHPATN